MKNQEKFFPTKKLPKPLGEGILIAGTQEEIDNLVSKANLQAVYYAWEVLLLKGMNDKMTETVHEIKKMFPGAVIKKTCNGR